MFNIYSPHSNHIQGRAPWLAKLLYYSRLAGVISAVDGDTPLVIIHKTMENHQAISGNHS